MQSGSQQVLSAVLYANITSRPSITLTGRISHPAQDNMAATSYSALDIFRLTVTAVVFLVTLAGNFAAIVYIHRHKELRSIKNYYYGFYLINLNVADLLVAVFCIPFTVVYYESKTWRFGGLFCKVMPTMQVIAVSASICTLAVITFERYRALIHPMVPRSTAYGLRVKLALIWAWAAVVGAPSLYAYKLDMTRSSYQCIEQWPTHGYRQGYTIFIFLMNYAIPLGYIFISYIVIVIRLKYGKTPYGENASKLLRNQFIKLMIMLIVSFAVCYLPGHICFFILDFGTGVNGQTFKTVILFAHLLTWVNSCLNPFFYCALNGFLKQQKKKLRKTSRLSLGSSSGDSFRKSFHREDQNENEMIFLAKWRQGRLSETLQPIVESCT